MVSAQASHSGVTLKKTKIAQIPCGPHGPCYDKAVLPSSINSPHILKQLPNDEASIFKKSAKTWMW